MLTVSSISVENLRGYTKSALRLEKLTVLVGENNEGKSSLLKMFEKLFSIADEFWNGDRVLSDEDFDFWYPANDAMHRARRFSVTVKFLDGRSARTFGVGKGDELDLRLAIAPTGICRLNIGTPRRSETHDDAGRDLLRKLKEHVRLILIPPVRDSRSSEFSQKLTHSVTEELRTRLSHNRQAGAPREYRLAKDAIAKIEQIVKLHAKGLATSAGSPLASMLTGSEVRVEVFPRDIYSLIEKSLYVYLTTGAHDVSKVAPGEVGNGLQSLIDIDLTIERFLSGITTSNQTKLLIVEEPEAFLHPSAQRQFMQFLRQALVEKVDSAVLTTHSPIILDEARYEEIVLVRNQRHYAPSARDGIRRSINTALMTSATAEVFFARTVIFVEGDGDKAFFNILIRRIRNLVPVSKSLAGIVFQPTGGCTFFSPWLKLVSSYGQGEDRPIHNLWLMDGDVASGDRTILRTAADCNFAFSEQERKTISDFGNSAWTPDTRTPHAISAVNNILESRSGYLFSCDFEWAMFNNAGLEATDSIKSTLAELQINIDGTFVEIARRLGSKVGTGRAADAPKKQAYIRARIAEDIPLGALPPEIFTFVRAIFLKALNSEAEVRALLSDAGVAVSKLNRTVLSRRSVVKAIA